MDSRTLFQHLIKHEPIERVMVDYWAEPEIDARLMKRFHCKEKVELLEQLGIDFRYLEGPRYVGPKLKVHEDGSEDDLWGVPRAVQFTGEGDFKGHYKYVPRFPLADAKTVEDLKHYGHWPDPDWYDYSVVYDQARAMKGRVRVFMGDRLNRIAQLKPAMYLRGIDRALVDVGRKSPIFYAINQKIADFYAEYLRRILAAARGEIDLIFTGDDFGTQNGPMLRPQLWRELLKPNFAKFIAISHEAGIPVAHHTCGSIYDFLPDFVDAKLDILNPLQPLTAKMDFPKIKQEFGAKLAFHGGVSLQGPLRFGTPAEVEREVKERIEVLGYGGGYIICTAHNIQADTRTENIVALFNAYATYREKV